MKNSLINIDYIKININTYIFLSIITFISFYNRFYLFGAYEDDLSQLRYFGINTKEKINLTFNYIVNFPMGRPVGFISLRVFTSFLYDLGGVNLLYLVSCFVLSTNSFLVHLIFRKLNFSYSLAIIGSLIFITFPGDALKMTIVRGFQVHLSILFCLLATLLFLNNKKITSYIIFFISLLIYENGIFIFLFASALKYKSLNINKNFKHVLFVVITVILVIVIRKYIGSGNRLDGMVGNFSDLDELLKIPLGIIGGLLMSFTSYIKKPIHLMLNFELWMMFITIVVFFSFYYLKKIKVFIIYPKNLKKDEYLSLFFIGFSSICLGYIVMSGHRFGAIWTEYGRVTSTHSQSAFGISLSFIIIIQFIRNFLIDEEKKKIIMSFLLTFLIAPGIIFGNFIQNKIILSWEKNKTLYAFIDKEISDWDEGLVLLIPPNYNNNRYVLGTAWNSFYVPGLIYDFPKNWKRKPVIIPENKLKFKNNKIYYVNLGKKIIVDDYKILFISENNNTLYRITDKSINIKLKENNKFKEKKIVPYKGEKFLVKKNLLYNFFIKKNVK